MVPMFQEALKNILIVFAKLNPGIRYVQGMNEILAPLFYVFKNESDEENAVSDEISVHSKFLSFWFDSVHLLALCYILCLS